MTERHPTRRRWSDESGSGVVSAPLSILVFLLFVFFAVQVMLHLSIVSRANALAFDLASAMARDEIPCLSPPNSGPAQARADAFGSQWNATVADCERDDTGVTRVRITGESPALIVEAVGSVAGLNTIVREVTVRTEELRP